MENINSSPKISLIPRLKDLVYICQTIVDACEEGKPEKVSTQINKLSDWIWLLDWEAIKNDPAWIDMCTITYTIHKANKILISKGLLCDSINDAFPPQILPETNFESNKSV